MAESISHPLNCSLTSSAAKRPSIYGVHTEGVLGSGGRM